MRADRRELTAIFAGGFVGTLMRAGMVELLPPDPGQWPWATFAVNVAGAALLGYVVTRFHAHLSDVRRSLLGTGLCGALTTFSAFQLELLELLDAGRPGLALVYAGASIAAGVTAGAVAARLTRRVQVAA